MSFENNIHVGFGFHVNLYHSYRGDSCDGFGFGSDIRIIRKIIQTLNAFNENGIPVKGTWDSDNVFSLEKILPEYAPDILSGLRERVEKYGDEHIIMGYSNGALGAMNEEELTASLELAVTNEQGSGIRDLFGKYAPIVRPQEVMFTPSQAAVYKRCGIKALCLYYSCIPFDSFKTIVPKLSDEEAFNPVSYHYKDDSITVIPTYSNADVCDAGCLRAWVKYLRKEQISGEINSDLFLFINMDADAIFWETLDLPLIKGKIANTDGIHGLVSEIADLPYVIFDTPGGYLKDHGPIGEIRFSQDTADGNFTGFSSWAEKPYNRKIWTAIERSRANSRAYYKNDKDSPSFADRLLLLSTTHFGLATPVLNIVREKKADELAEKIKLAGSHTAADGDSLFIRNINGSDFQCAQLLFSEGEDGYTVALSSDDLLSYSVVKNQNGTLFALMKFKIVRDRYELKVNKCAEASVGDRELSLKTNETEMFFSRFTGIREVRYKGRLIGDEHFLNSYITYDGRQYRFQILGVNAVPVSGDGKCIRISGCIHLPGECSGGSFCYDFLTVPFADSVFIRSEVSYPYTPESDSISTENSTLGRYTDNRWIECAPFELAPIFGSDLNVVKRNFDGDVSSFRVDAFRECDPENKKLDSFNHQLSGGFVGLSGDECGLLFSVSRQVLNSMACCPMRLYENGKVSMNPFGTYFGKQRHHFSMSKNRIQEAYMLIAAQGKSLAPSYNGVSETSFNAISFFDVKMPDDGKTAEACAFSDGCIIEADKDCPVQPFTGDNIITKTAVSGSEDNEKLRNPVFYGVKGNIGKYVICGSKAITHIIRAQLKAKENS